MNKKPNKSRYYFYVDCEDAWTCLENGKPIDSLYPDYFQSETRDNKYHDHMASIILPNEKYILLEDKFYDYALTSFGRVVNCVYGTQFGTYFKKTDIALFMRGSRLHLSKAFKEQNWEFDMQKILDNYNKYKWNYSCVSSMQHQHKKSNKVKQNDK